MVALVLVLAAAELAELPAGLELAELAVLPASLAEEEILAHCILPRRERSRDLPFWSLALPPGPQRR